MATARRKKIWYLLDSMPELLKRLNRKLTAAGNPPLSMRRLRQLIGDVTYGQQTANNCCCALCRDLGIVSFDVLRLIVKVLTTDKALIKRLFDEIDRTERYMRQERRWHLQEASACGKHCLRCLLSPENDDDFCHQCTHGRDDKANVEPLKPLAESLGRTLKPSDHNGECMVCAEGTGTLKCQCCSNTAHMGCMRQQYHDLGSGQWMCPICSATKVENTHDEQCAACNGIDYLLATLEALVKVSCHEAERDSRLLANVEWAEAMLADAKESLQRYDAHLIQDHAQESFAGWSLDNMPSSGVSTLDDYYAKQGARHFNTGCCEEGKADKSTSILGRCVVYKNPAVATRAQHSNTDWGCYPEPPESGGPVYCREAFRLLSDSSSQNSSDTAQTRLTADDIFFKNRLFLRFQDLQQDGASNFHSTDPIMYNMKNEFVRCVVTTIAGMGKGKVDGDNGGCQPKWERYLNTENDLTCAAEFRTPLDQDRVTGKVNTIIEPGQGGAMTDSEKKKREVIPYAKDMKVR